MAIKRGYIRVGEDFPSEADQRKALRVAGAKAVYVDKPTPNQLRLGAACLINRSQCISDIGRHPDGTIDEIVVCGPWILGISPVDLLAVLAETGKRGAVVNDLSSGRKIRWIPEMDEIAEMVSAWSEFRVSRKMEKITATLAEREKKRGPQPKISGEGLRIFLVEWFSNHAGSQAKIARKYGISLATAKRMTKTKEAESILKDMQSETHKSDI